MERTKIMFSETRLVPLPVSTGLCSECEMITTARCISCLLPLCNWCGRDCEPGICPWCHYARGCDKPDCAATGRTPLTETVTA